MKTPFPTLPVIHLSFSTSPETNNPNDVKITQGNPDMPLYLISSFSLNISLQHRSLECSHHAFCSYSDITAGFFFSHLNITNSSSYPSIRQFSHPISRSGPTHTPFAQFSLFSSVFGRDLLLIFNFSVMTFLAPLPFPSPPYTAGGRLIR